VDSLLVVSNLYGICFQKFCNVQQSLKFFVVDHRHFFILATYTCGFHALGGRHLPLQYWSLPAITADLRLTPSVHP
jgi:hypothetical protein